MNHTVAKEQGIKICLVGGTGRSGTTVLNRIFSSHPLVSDVPEWRFEIDPDGIIDFYVTLSHEWSPYLYDLKLKRLQTLLKSVTRDRLPSKLGYLAEELLRRCGSRLKWAPQYSKIQAIEVCPRFSQLADSLIEELTEFRFVGSWIGMKALSKAELLYAKPPEREKLALILGNFLREVARCVLETQNAQYYLEKNTWNILWFDRLRELLPEAKIVHIYRDPRDVVASFTRQTWMPSDPVQSAYVYRDIIHRWWRMMEKLPLESYREISLENLVRKPESVLRELCTFWCIDWHDNLLKTDLTRSHMGRWKTDIPKEQQEEVGRILREPLERMGYA